MDRSPTLAEIAEFVKQEKDNITFKLMLFDQCVAWAESDYKVYTQLLEHLKKVKRKYSSTTKEIGDALEKIVDFIFEKSYFYEVYTNKRSSTHEIDQFVVLSKKGKQALKDFNFTRELLFSEKNYLLCECKNYKEAVGATWVGKFNTLMDISDDCDLGIIFSCNGLTGQENNWYDAHGLTKVIYRLSPHDKKRYILDFNMRDFEALMDPSNNIFKIIEAKKTALILSVKSEKLYNELHEGHDEVLKILDELKCSL